METNNDKFSSIATNRPEPKIWIFIQRMIIFGITLLFILSFRSIVILSPPLTSPSNIQNFVYYLSALGVSLLVAGACFCLGALCGFLFGIPRVINSSNVPDNLKKAAVIVQNDNLVQISDWLTKIIVGVGLTQLYKIPSALYLLGENLSTCFTRNDIQDKASIYISIVIVLYFLILGFIACYLWTRLFFSNMLRKNSEDVDNVNEAI
jgi:hypothetical protein